MTVLLKKTKVKTGHTELLEHLLVQVHILQMDLDIILKELMSSKDEVMPLPEAIELDKVSRYKVSGNKIALNIRSVSIRS